MLHKKQKKKQNFQSTRELKRKKWATTKIFIKRNCFNRIKYTVSVEFPVLFLKVSESMVIKIVREDEEVEKKRKKNYAKSTTISIIMFILYGLLIMTICINIFCSTLNSDYNLNYGQFCVWVHNDLIHTAYCVMLCCAMPDSCVFVCA